MSDLQKIAKRIMRMIEAGETGQDVFVRDAGTLAELILNIEELTTKRYELLGRKRPSFKRALVGQLLFPFYPLHSTDFVHTHELSCH